MCMCIYFSGKDNVPCFPLKLLADLELSSPLAALPECIFLLLHVDFGASTWKRRWQEMHEKGKCGWMPLQCTASKPTQFLHTLYTFSVSCTSQTRYSLLPSVWLVQPKREAKGMLVWGRTTKLLIPMGCFRVRIISAYSSCTDAGLFPESHKTTVK